MQTIVEALFLIGIALIISSIPFYFAAKNVLIERGKEGFHFEEHAFLGLFTFGAMFAFVCGALLVVNFITEGIR